MAIRYEFTDDRTPLGFKNADKADPQKIGEALAGIVVEKGGYVNAEDVIAAAAADRRHYLRQFITWSDKDAAKAHRLNEARAIIRSVEIVEVDAPNDTRRRAFISLTADRQRSYRPVQIIEADVRLQLAVMQDAIRYLRSFRRRYRQMADICALVEIAEAGIEARMGDAAPPPAVSS